MNRVERAPILDITGTRRYVWCAVPAAMHDNAYRAARRREKKERRFIRGSGNPPELSEWRTWGREKRWGPRTRACGPRVRGGYENAACPGYPLASRPRLFPVAGFEIRPGLRKHRRSGFPATQR